MISPRRPTLHLSRSQRIALGLVGVALSACTTVNSSTVKSARDSGATRSYDRSTADLYQASLLAIDSLRASDDWRELQVVERDPDRGVIVAERRLDSRIIPGLGHRDAFGIFVTPRSTGAGDVTVVALASDQILGQAGTSLGSWRTAQGLIFPSIDEALRTIPASVTMTERAAATLSPPAVSGVGPVEPEDTERAKSPTEAEPRSRTAPGASPAALGDRVAASSRPSASEPEAVPGQATLDKVYQVLRERGTWRPLVRETRQDGGEEIRVGNWARLQFEGQRPVLTVRDGPGTAANAAKLALELSRAGFEVEVESERARP